MSKAEIHVFISKIGQKSDLYTLNFIACEKASGTLAY